MESSAEELRFSLAEEGFDRSQLPPGSGAPGSEGFRQAVTDFFRNAYRSRGGRVEVAFTDGRIDVHWSGQQEQQAVLDRALALIEQGRRGEARSLLEAVLQLEPGSTEALYNLGLLCSDAGEWQNARELLERCVTLQPAHGVDLDAHADEADQLLCRVLELAPRGEMAEKARRASRRIADHNLRRRQGEGLRQAVVGGLLEALRTYERLKAEQRKALLVEVAAIGEKGLPVNRPEASYRLETLPGAFTALQLACLIEVGARQVLGMAEGGFGFEAEMLEAQRRLQDSRGSAA